MQNGIIVEPTDHKAVADAILAIMLNKDKWQKYSVNGNKNILAYSWPSHCIKYLDHIEAIKNQVRLNLVDLTLSTENLWFTNSEFVTSLVPQVSCQSSSSQVEVALACVHIVVHCSRPCVRRTTALARSSCETQLSASQCLQEEQRMLKGLSRRRASQGRHSMDQVGAALHSYLGEIATTGEGKVRPRLVSLAVHECALQSDAAANRNYMAASTIRTSVRACVSAPRACLSVVTAAG